jgi:hypothetical protein
VAKPSPSGCCTSKAAPLLSAHERQMESHVRHSESESQQILASANSLQVVMTTVVVLNVKHSQ